jgi:hypothetical protein
MTARTRIMYVECKSGGLANPGRIGRVAFSKSGATLSYGGRRFQSLKGRGSKANYFDLESGEAFWISGPRRDGADGLYGRLTQAEDVDADVSDAYWRDIRGRRRPIQKFRGAHPFPPPSTEPCDDQRIRRDHRQEQPHLLHVGFSASDIAQRSAASHVTGR